MTSCSCACHKKPGIVHIIPCCSGSKFTHATEINRSAVEDICPSSYTEIKQKLGQVVPCYNATGGCVLHDDENEKKCEEGCFILNVYREGVIAGLTHKKEVFQPLGRAIEQHLRDYGEDRPDHQGQPIMLYMSDVKKIRELLREK